MLVKVGTLPSSIEAFESALLIDMKNPDLILLLRSDLSASEQI